MRLLLLVLLVTQILFSQSKDEILAEGWLLYKSEKASWHGTDIFMEKYPEKRTSVGGYLSYSEGGHNKCIFFDKENEPNVLATIAFDDNFVVEHANIDTTPRKLTQNEAEIHLIRKKVLERINSDTIFKRYENTSFNIVPLIVKKKKVAYVLTGPRNNGVVIFGNDYLVSFDNKNNVKSIKQLHANIIPIEMGDENVVSTIHSHVHKTGDLITATDICTLLLYGPYTHWKSHIVISEDNVSIWDVGKRDLLVMTRKAWEKINDGDKD